jgi:hypothetical protein
MRLLAPEGAETATATGETTVVAPPQEEPIAQDTTPDEGGNGQEEPKDGTTVELEGFEQQDDGRIKLAWGDSVYFSDAGLKGDAAIANAFAKARAASVEKDKSYLELKAKTSIKPEPKKPVQEQPKYTQDQFAQAVFKRHNLDPEMAYWDNARWKVWARETDENGERIREPFEVTESKDLVERAWKESVQRFDVQELTYKNEETISIATDNIRGLLVSIKVDPDKYADTYAQILGRLETEKESFYTAKGELRPGVIEREMSKAIFSDLTPKQESELRKKILTEQEEAIKKRAKVHPIGSVQKQFKPTTKEPQSLADARNSALRALRAGRLG